MFMGVAKQPEVPSPDGAAMAPSALGERDAGKEPAGVEAAVPVAGLERTLAGCCAVQGRCGRGFVVRLIAMGADMVFAFCRGKALKALMRTGLRRQADARTVQNGTDFTVLRHAGDSRNVKAVCVLLDAGVNVDSRARQLLPLMLHVLRA
jgi:hypothetical protein